MLANLATSGCHGCCLLSLAPVYRRWLTVREVVGVNPLRAFHVSALRRNGLDKTKARRPLWCRWKNSKLAQDIDHGPLNAGPHLHLRDVCLH